MRTTIWGNSEGCSFSRTIEFAKREGKAVREFAKQALEHSECCKLRSSQVEFLQSIAGWPEMVLVTSNGRKRFAAIWNRIRCCWDELVGYEVRLERDLQEEAARRLEAYETWREARLAEPPTIFDGMTRGSASFLRIGP